MLRVLRTACALAVMCWRWRRCIAHRSNSPECLQRGFGTPDAYAELGRDVTEALAQLVLAAEQKRQAAAEETARVRQRQRAVVDLANIPPGESSRFAGGRAPCSSESA